MSALLALVPAWLRWTALAGAVAAVAGGIAWLQHRAWREGFDAAIAQIAAQDKEAIDAAELARERVRACRYGGGVWDAAAGECRW